MPPSAICMGPSCVALHPSQGQSRDQGRQGLALLRPTALRQGAVVPFCPPILSPPGVLQDSCVKSLVHHN